MEMTAYLTFNKAAREFNYSLFNTSAANYFEPIIEKYFPNYSLVQIKGIVKDIKAEQNNKITVTIQPNKNWKSFKAGQYIELGIKINGMHYKRPFTISSSVAQFEKYKTISVTIQRIDAGKVTTHLFEHLKTGDVVSLSQAQGDFIHGTENIPLLYIAGGTGITPFRSMLYECLQTNRHVTLLYYAKAGQHLFADEFTALHEADNINIHLIETDIHGRISTDHLDKYCSDLLFRNVYLCGPAAMTATAKKILLHQKVQEKNIHTEHFTLPAIPATTHLKDNKGTVSVQNKQLPTTGTTTVLEAMEANGLQPAYGCRMGICKQCQCKKNTGVVLNRLTGIYSEQGEGYILPCVSIPIGAINIDL